MLGNVARCITQLIRLLSADMWVIMLAAVGSAFPVMHIGLVLFVGVATGAGIMALLWGKDRETPSRTIGVDDLNCYRGNDNMIVGPLMSGCCISQYT